MSNGNEYIHTGVHPNVSVKAFVSFVAKDGSVHEWLMRKTYDHMPTKAEVLADAKMTTGCDNTEIINAQATTTPFVHKTRGCLEPNF